MKRIGIIAKVQHPGSESAVLNLIHWLKEKDIEAVLDKETAAVVKQKSDYNRADLPELSDVIIVLGGDGTLISVARLIDNRKVPILGVNLGTLGFLTEIAFEEVYSTLEKVLSGDFKTVERLMIDARVIREGREVGYYNALNDIVINRGTLARIVDMEVKIDGLYVSSYRADGFIVASPTGSTAYALAAGGPIVYPTLSALVLAPICPHNLTNRPIVVPDSVEIEISFLTNDEDVLATIDGQIGFSLTYRDKILIKKSMNSTLIIQSPQKNYYQILREKLKWGERIGREHLL
ncbi:MAG: NAD(+)/NADH kinase [Nitrospinota bacterium]